MLMKFSLPDSVKVLGMMSGTSGDGIDGVLVEFAADGSAKLLWHESYDFSPAQFARIQSLMSGVDASTVTLGNSYIAELYALACSQFFADKTDLPDFIAAHGQTVFHQPVPIVWDDLKLTGTLQLMNGCLLAHRAKVPVICNFRAADMAVGGQGAPLVPFADLFLFGKKTKNDLVVVNIGGMANITVIGNRGGRTEVVCAFDTGPGNVLMDICMQQNHLGRFDRGGSLAAMGTTCGPALEEFLRDPYFSLLPPKSTGREYFNHQSLARIIRLMPAGYTHADLLSTLLDVTVNSIADAIVAQLSVLRAPLEVLVAGGGALNNTLMQRLKTRLHGVALVDTTDKYLVPVMGREAMAFAVLGYAFVKNISSNVTVATGATDPVTLGEYHPC